jgi:hypothetical protein
MARYVPRLSKASALREVEVRYREMAKRKAGRTSPVRTMAAARISEIQRIFDYRYGRAQIVPATDEGFQAARVMVHHIGRLKHSQRRMSDWLLRCAPWMSPRDHERLISEVEECPLKWTADKLAWKLRLTQAEREGLGITTIGAIDLPKAERVKRRAIAKRERMRAIRKTKGAMSRAEYRQAVRSAKPWEAQGLSRATWYRKHRVRQ